MLKNYGYHLEDNFGHGQQYLALLRVMLNWLAFLLHTPLDLCDAHYRRVRAELATRQTFFHDVQALPRYLYFASWQALSNFMFTQRETRHRCPGTTAETHQTPLMPAAARAQLSGAACTWVVCAPATFRAKQSPETHDAPTCRSAPTAVPKACSPC